VIMFQRESGLREAWRARLRKARDDIADYAQPLSIALYCLIAQCKNAHLPQR